MPTLELALKATQNKYKPLKPYKTSLGAAKHALKLLEEIHLWKNPIISLQETKEQKEIGIIAEGLGDLLGEYMEMLYEEKKLDPEVCVSYYDILSHLPFTIFAHFFREPQVNTLDPRLIVKIETHTIKGVHFIYLIDQYGRRVEKLRNNIGYLKTITAVTKRSEAQKYNLKYYERYGKEIDAYDRIRSRVTISIDSLGPYSESMGDTIAKDPRPAVVRVGKNIEVIRYIGDDDEQISHQIN
jgi:hypothetical protein